MTRVTVLSPLHHDGAVYGVGEPAELPEDTATHLAGRGIVEIDPVPAEPQNQASDGEAAAAASPDSPVDASPLPVEETAASGPSEPAAAAQPPAEPQPKPRGRRPRAG